MKASFPVFENDVNLAYWDSAASGLKLGIALEQEYNFLKQRYANVHRGVYHLSAVASQDFEESRRYLAMHFDCDTDGFVFVRGATEGINLFAAAVIEPSIQSGQNIVITQLEHHANILVWRELCRKKKCELRVVALHPSGHLDIRHLEQLVDDDTHLISMTHASNVTGTINDLSWIKRAKQRGIWTLVDGAQMVAHRDVSIRTLEADAYVVSAHKMYGPNGIGAVMLSARARANAQPYQRGGGMVAKILPDSEVFHADPWRFEAGTPHISGAIGFATACRWLNEHRTVIEKIEKETFSYLMERWNKQMQNVPTWTDPNGVGIVAFDMPGVHAHDLATLCDVQNVAIRAGHHCAYPLIQALGRQAVARISLGAYNDKRDVDQLMKVLSLALGSGYVE